MRTFTYITGALLTAVSPAYALTISSTTDPFSLANTLFLNQPNLVLNGATLFSSAQSPDASEVGDQAGIYLNSAGTYGLPNSGIVLSSGDVSNYGTGPNTDSGLTGVFGIEASADQETMLQPITGIDQHFDPVQLDIEFFVDADISEVTFFAAFGSEEFPEFQFSNVTDGFGLFVNGVNVAGAVPTGGATPLAINIDHPDMTALPGTELDGVLAPNGNPILRFDVPINAGELNEFSIILADAGDGLLDTTVYLTSFFADTGGASGGSEFDPLLPSNLPDPDTGEFIIELPEVPEGQTIWVDPPVSVGYVYEVSGGNEVASVTAPSLATVPDLDGYLLTVGGTSVSLAAGATLNFLSTFGTTASMFTLTGIGESLMLDPADPLAFPIGLTFANTVAAGAIVGITPITKDTGGAAVVPLPAAGVLYVFGLLGGGALLRRRRKAA